MGGAETATTNYATTANSPQPAWGRRMLPPPRSGKHATAFLLLASHLLLGAVGTSAVTPAGAEAPGYDRHENALELIGVRRTEERWADPAFLALTVRASQPCWPLGRHRMNPNRSRHSPTIAFERQRDFLLYGTELWQGQSGRGRWGQHRKWAYRGPMNQAPLARFLP